MIPREHLEASFGNIGRLASRVQSSWYVGSQDGRRDKNRLLLRSIAHLHVTPLVIRLPNVGAAANLASPALGVVAKKHFGGRVEISRTRERFRNTRVSPFGGRAWFRDGGDLGGDDDRPTRRLSARYVSLWCNRRKDGGETGKLKVHDSRLARFHANCETPHVSRECRRLIGPFWTGVTNFPFAVLGRFLHALGAKEDVGFNFTEATRNARGDVEG